MYGYDVLCLRSVIGALLGPVGPGGGAGSPAPARVEPAAAVRAVARPATPAATRENR